MHTAMLGAGYILCLASTSCVYGSMLCVYSAGCFARCRLYMHSPLGKELLLKMAGVSPSG